VVGLIVFQLFEKSIPSKMGLIHGRYRWRFLICCRVYAVSSGVRGKDESKRAAGKYIFSKPAMDTLAKDGY
jgi:hypothetical protein